MYTHYAQIYWESHSICNKIMIYRDINGTLRISFKYYDVTFTDQVNSTYRQDTTSITLLPMLLSFLVELASSALRYPFTCR